MEDLPSENVCPSEPQPRSESPRRKRSTSCRSITIERSHSARWSPKSKDSKKSLQSMSSNECPSTASSRSKLEHTADIKPPPRKPPVSEPTTPAVKPLPAVPPPNAQSSSCPPDKDKVESAVTAHQEAVSTLKCAVNDLFCKAITSTHNAITKISNGMESIKKTASEMIPERKKKCDCPAATTTTVKKVSNEPSDTNVSRLDSRITSTENIERNPTASGKSLPNVNNQVKQAWNFVIQKVDSAVSVFSDSVCYSIQPKSFNDRSSKYDVPKPRPKDVSACSDDAEDMSWHPGIFHLFSSIKEEVDKVWGKFPEAEKKSNRSSATSVTSETDDYFVLLTIPN